MIIKIEVDTTGLGPEGRDPQAVLGQRARVAMESLANPERTDPGILRVGRILVHPADTVSLEPGPTRDEVIALAKGGGLDDLVHDDLSGQASDINNSGEKAQVDYLLASGHTLKDLQKHLEDA